MAINFPVPTATGQLYTDNTSGTTYTCTSVGPPAVWIGSDSTTALEGSITRKQTYTPVSTTSGTSFTFSSVPSWAKKVTIVLDSVEFGGTTNTSLAITLGDAGGSETTGYTAVSTDLFEPFGTVSTSSSSFLAKASTGSIPTNEFVISGVLTLTLHSSSTNTWVFRGETSTLAPPPTADTDWKLFASTGSKSLSQPLTQVTITTFAGIQFAGGSISVFVEG